MVENKKIIKIIDGICPFERAMDGDNCGLIVGRENGFSGRVLLCLDVTNEVIDEAIDSGCNMIVSHHPIIYSPIKQVSDLKAKGSDLLKLIENDITVVCAHTCLDKARGGINNYLCNQFGFTKPQPIDELDGLMWVGEFGGTLEALRNTVYSNLHQNIGVVCLGNTFVNKVAVASGSGGGNAEYIDIAMKNGATALITGEIKHHVALYARANNFSMLEFSHYISERSYLPEFKRLLDMELNAQNLRVEIIISEREVNPLQY